MTQRSRIIPVDIVDEMKSAYIDYSMSVIVSRALPDVRDGLKPVHRRVLFGMSELGLVYNKAHKKSARIVGEVLGKYHPHGDSSVYDSMVRMAQDWSLRYPLVDGQGNFGSMDGDSPAAMRYTEARLEKISDEILADLKKETVDFQLNFDDTLHEPTVLPTKLPNLLVNGASGIAVGMATNMLPHNLTEVVNGVVAAIDNPDITIEELMQYIKAPDFPTGGIIYGVTGVKQAYETGRGRVVVRAKTDIESSSTGRERIIITEIPYQVNKAILIEKIAHLVGEKKIEGISDIRDESDRTGLRIVIEIRKDALGNVVLSKLFKYTALQSSYGVNNIALVNGRPQQLNLKDLIVHFIDFRMEVVVRRTKYDLRKAEERSHILEGLLIALDHLDEVIALIRASKTVEIAKNGLMTTFSLSEIQAKAILEMRLQKLTGLERDKVKSEFEELQKKIAHYKAILGSEEMQKDIIKGELQEVMENFGDERRTEITFAEGDINIEDMIANDEVVVTISHMGYIKRTPSEEYRKQGRGGRGSKGSKTRDEDFVEHIFVANNHDYLLLFTSGGRCHWMRVYEIPETTKNSLGRVIQNIVNIPKEEKIRAYIKVEDLKNEEFLKNNYIIFATKKGLLKKTLVESYSRIRTNGINAITIKDDDQLLSAQLTDGKSNVIIASRYGYAVRFEEEKVRPMGRMAAGVRGIRLKDEDDEVVGMFTFHPDDEETSILVVSENGYAKRANLDDYRLTNRGGKGVKTLNVTDKTGRLIGIKKVKDDNDLMITTTKGIVIRMAVSSLRVMGRATQGVKAIKLSDGDLIGDIAIVPASKEEDLDNIEASWEEEGSEGAKDESNQKEKPEKTDDSETNEDDKTS